MIRKLLSVAVALCVATTLNAQHASRDSSAALPKNAIKVNVFSALVRVASAYYERTISDRWSLQAGLMYHSPGELPLAWRSDVKKGYGVTSEARFYPLARQKAPKGLYLAPYLRYRYMEIEVEELSKTGYGKITTYGGGALLGYQALALHNHLSFDFFVGPNFAGHRFRTEGFIKHPDAYNTYRLFDNAGIRSGFLVGFAF